MVSIESAILAKIVPRCASRHIAQRLIHRTDGLFSMTRTHSI